MDSIESSSVAQALSEADVARFIRDGFVRINGAFSPEIAAAARRILWRDLGASPDDRATWTRPVVRLGNYGQVPFVVAANTPFLHSAFDRLVGAGRWLPCLSVGTFPVRFPSAADAGDTGWHVDMSFDYDRPDFMDWRINIRSRGRALLMLFLFSDVGEEDAPTRLRVGSHRDIARALAPAGPTGLTMRELMPAIAATQGREEATATGNAGTVYLCHPFIVHAAQPHRGRRPRFLAQPPLLPHEPLRLDRPAADTSPVEEAIRSALA
jgi:hypothetical protein